MPTGDQAFAGLGRTPGLPVGSEVPCVPLATLAGETKSIPDLVTAPTVVLCWNPDCGYCRAMHDDVLEWEASRAPEAPDLRVVSAGTVGDARAEGFASAVLLDPDWTAASALGADGTPMAVRIEPNGRIASPVVSGATEAFTFLRGRESAAAS